MPDLSLGLIPFVAWLVAGVCFILAIGGLSKHETARRGNMFGIIGIVIAIVATILRMTQIDAPYEFGTTAYILLVVAIVGGGVIGAVMASKVEMKGMPQLVAMLHSFVGLAAVFVGIAGYLMPSAFEVFEANLLSEQGPEIATAVASGNEGTDELIAEMKSHPIGGDLTHKIEIILGVFIGGLTFTGSVIAWGKLEGRIKSKPLMLPARHLLNLIMLLSCVGLAVWFCYESESRSIGMIPLLLVTIISFVFGVHMVMAIGGADMPVVVSMLNSYSGWAAAATGFMLGNDLLIITGAIVGSSGAILSYIMCHAMNRSFISVIMGGFGTDSGNVIARDDGEQKTHIAVTAEEVAGMLKDANEVIVVPGYGMAVAQAQHPIREMTEILKEGGTQTRFAIHPVAGRLPGHMNVLLAEARVPYDLVLEMEEINEDFPETDVVLVIGANDIVNPGALDDPSSPIYGMPVLEAWKSTQVIVFKRSMATGYSGVDNPLFYNENTGMLFGDAKASTDEILKHLRG
ncbi:MAG: NAD(P)(+) transhydrogenase (Re/Si-specific) subunit beta [Planctomycetota bacterium]